MTKVYFTSDTHFGHERILTVGKGRPFKTIEEHDKEIVHRWNETVEPDSTVYILGDIFFKSYDENARERILQSLHGSKYIILGNHDKKNDFTEMLNKGIIKGVYDYLEKDLKTSNGKTIFCVMCHYPILEFNHAYRDNSVMLYGHVHETGERYKKIYEDIGFRAFHIGVDTNDFSPISLDEIWKKVNG